MNQLLLELAKTIRILILSEQTLGSEMAESIQARVGELREELIQQFPEEDRKACTKALDEDMERLFSFMRENGDHIPELPKPKPPKPPKPAGVLFKNGLGKPRKRKKKEE